MKNEAKQSGQEYKKADGTLVPAKTMKTNPCVKCPNKCGKIQDARREQIFNHFWQLPQQRKKDWIVSMTQKMPFKLERAKSYGYISDRDRSNTDKSKFINAKMKAVYSKLPTYIYLINFAINLVDVRHPVSLKIDKLTSTFVMIASGTISKIFLICRTYQANLFSYRESQRPACKLLRLKELFVLSSQQIGRVQTLIINLHIYRTPILYKLGLNILNFCKQEMYFESIKMTRLLKTCYDNDFLKSESNLLAAIPGYKNSNLGLNECSRTYRVLKATIKRHTEGENSVSNKVKALGRQYFPPILKKNKIIAGEKWFYDFFKRNPFKIFHSASLKKRLSMRFTPDSIFDADELGFITVQKSPQKVVALKGKHQVVTETIRDNGSNFLKAFQENVEFYVAENQEFEYINHAFEYDEVQLPFHLRCSTHTLNLCATVDFNKLIQSSEEPIGIIHKRTLDKCNVLWNASNHPKSA
ncbi:hypothetical protein ABEB36_008277 [Hypothenemus hampei]|uniref:Transposase n=1 Tax=Hypothenemus hampei TaxID=57062 RepID=A0ABD1ELS1_HYPHA